MILSVPSILTDHSWTDKVWGPGKHVPLLTYPRLSTLNGELGYSKTGEMLISKACEIIVTELDFERILACYLQHLCWKKHEVKDQLSMHLSSIPRNNLVASFLVSFSCIHAVFMLVSVCRLFLFSIADFLELQKYEQHVVLNEFVWLAGYCMTRYAVSIRTGLLCMCSAYLWMPLVLKCIFMGLKMKFSPKRL